MLTQKEADKLGNRYWKTIVEPTSYPITVEEVKSFARIDGNEEDDLILSFIKSVVKYTETYLGKALNQRTIRMSMDEWNEREIELPFPPLLSISSVETVDEDDITTTYASSNYYVITESEPGKLIIRKDCTLPINTERYTGGYRITYIAGYITVPEEIRIAMMQWVTLIYENRSMTDNTMLNNEPPSEVKKVLRPFRVIRI